MSKLLNVLIVDDRQSDIERIVNELEGGDYTLETRHVSGKGQFRRELESQPWDLIISEYELPGFNALAAIEILQQQGIDIPFIIFTNTSEEETIVSALKAGAHDFILQEHAGRLLPAIQRELVDAESRRERWRAEKVRELILKFSQVTLTAQSLEELLGHVHETISGLMRADNLYVALHNEDSDTLSFPYFIDEYDQPPPPSKLGKGLTEYILRSGKSVLASPELFEELVSKDEVELIGAPSIDWMGVPLRVRDKTFGVLAVQSYTEGVRYRKEDIEILTFVSDQISMSIERMRTEQALRDEIAFRNTIESSILAGIFAFDRQGYQTYVNPAFCRMVGWSEEELINTKQPYVYWPAEEIEIISEAFQITTGEDAIPSDFELRFQRKNGERFDVYLLISPLRDTTGEVEGWLASVYDITERKYAEEVIRRQTKNAEALAHMAERLNARLDLQTVIDTVCEETAHALNVHTACLFLYHPESELFHLSASYGIPEEYLPRFAPLPPSELQPPADEKPSNITMLDVLSRSGLVNEKIHLDLNVRTMVSVNMVRDYHPIGSLVVFAIGKERRFSDDEMTLLQGMASLAEQAIINARLFEETEHHLELFRSLRAIDLAISTSLDLNVTLNILLEQVLSVLHVDAADILLYNVPVEKLEFAVGRGFRSALPAVPSEQQIPKGFASQAVMNRRSINVGNLLDVTHDPKALAFFSAEDFLTYSAVPLIAKNHVRGVLEIYQRSSVECKSDWQELLETLAGQAAIAIDNSSLFDQLQRSNAELVLAFDSALEGWVATLDLRDSENPDHTRHVTEMSLQIAQAMGMKDESLVHIRRGALLHDIGKIRISERILSKPSPLSEEEWLIIKQHPVYANEILNPLSYLGAAVEIPYHHHEKWDGSGYPQGLSGAEIPLAARIFAVADVWDSLRSDSPYRSAWPEEKTLRYIQEQSGKHFDPQVVHTFMSLVS